MDWQNALRILHTARWPVARGKRIDRNTKLFLVGSFEKPERIDLQFHRTMIVRFYPDGSKDINVGWSTTTTRERLRSFGGVSVYRAPLASINGYRPELEFAYFMHDTRHGARESEVPYHGVNDYVHIDPEGFADPNTVLPYTTNYVENAAALRKKMRHLGRIAKLLLGLKKLAGADEDYFQNGRVNALAWFLQRVDVPLTDVELSPYPLIYPYRNTTIASQLKAAREAIRWDIAKKNGWIGQADVLRSRYGSSGSN
jgi:hypothetical protein